MTTTVEFVGVAAAMADLRAWAQQVGPAVEAASAGFGQHVADEVASRVPFLSGQLASSVETSATSGGVEVSMGDGVPYAGWIEFGGSRGRPYIAEGRYLAPTALAATDEFAQIAADAASDAAGRFPWSTPSPS